VSRAFEKYEGLGNNFLVLDARAWPEAELTPSLARALCDRNTGVGGDGLLWVERSEARALRMVILNADGSRPEMCGNGVRCVAAAVAAREGLAAGDVIDVMSDAGPRPAVLREAIRGGWLVEVDMGVAKVSPEALAVPSDKGLQRVVAVDMGNPHGVLFDASGEAMSLVREVTALEVFPRGVNVELVVTDGDGFRVRVHERGVGWTQACGTGACAVAAAAVREGRAAAGRPLRVTLDGGDLTIAIEPETWRVKMTGPARRVFSGAVD
jgi:diaminopimelate epimerase